MAKSPSERYTDTATLLRNLKQGAQLSPVANLTAQNIAQSSRMLTTARLALATDDAHLGTIRLVCC